MDKYTLKMVKLCSACLLGIKCTWDCEDKYNEKVIELSKREILIPVCPEQLGGLPTPREPSEQKGDEVFRKDGKNVTKNFIKGAEHVLELVKLFNIKEAILKQKSPSCGCGKIFDGTFSKTLTKGDGITTSLLKKNGIKVISEEEL
jgi:uncharacterized protein YbbK (DUF523 family)